MPQVGVKVLRSGRIDPSPDNLRVFRKYFLTSFAGQGLKTGPVQRLAACSGISSIVCIHRHHSVKSILKAGFLAVNAANQALHGRKLLGVTGQHVVHAGFQRGQCSGVFGVL